MFSNQLFLRGIVIRVIFDAGNGGDPTKVEPFTLVREYPVQWVRVRIDLGEIKDLRSKGWSFARIAKHFGRSESGIFERFKRHGCDRMGIKGEKLMCCPSSFDTTHHEKQQLLLHGTSQTDEPLAAAEEKICFN